MCSSYSRNWRTKGLSASPDEIRAGFYGLSVRKSLKVIHRRCRPTGNETGHFLSSAESATNLRVPHPPGFPVRLGGVNEPHAAFCIESRTRCHGWGRAVGNPGSFALFAKGGIPRTSIPTVAYPTLEPKERVQGWGTRLYVVLPAVPNTNRGLIEPVSYQEMRRNSRETRSMNPS